MVNCGSRSRMTSRASGVGRNVQTIGRLETGHAHPAPQRPEQQGPVEPPRHARVRQREQQAASRRTDSPLLAEAFRTAPTSSGCAGGPRRQVPHVRRPHPGVLDKEDAVAVGRQRRHDFLMPCQMKSQSIDEMQTMSERLSIMAWTARPRAASIETGRAMRSRNRWPMLRSRSVICTCAAVATNARSCGNHDSRMRDAESQTLRRRTARAPAAAARSQHTRDRRRAYSASSRGAQIGLAGLRIEHLDDARPSCSRDPQPGMSRPFGAQSRTSGRADAVRRGSS